MLEGEKGPGCLFTFAFWSLQLWVEERLPLAQSPDYGTNLQTVQLFIKKNQVSPALPAQPHTPARCFPASVWPPLPKTTTADTGSEDQALESTDSCARPAL